MVLLFCQRHFHPLPNNYVVLTASVGHIRTEALQQRIRHPSEEVNSRRLHHPNKFLNINHYLAPSLRFNQRHRWVAHRTPTPCEKFLRSLSFGISCTLNCEPYPHAKMLSPRGVCSRIPHTMSRQCCITYHRKAHIIPFFVTPRLRALLKFLPS